MGAWEVLEEKWDMDIKNKCYLDVWKSQETKVYFKVYIVELRKVTERMLTT